MEKALKFAVAAITSLLISLSALAQDQDIAALRQKAEAGDAVAQLSLGYEYYVEKNSTEANKWFRLAAEQGNADAQWYLGLMCSEGLGVKKSDAEAAKWYRLAAEQGHGAAQTNLGVLYANGLGVSQSNTEAVKWYRRAAEQGWPKAQFYLGVRYFNGQGVAQSDTEAANWFRKAAELGNADAKAKLTFMYENGRGMAQSNTVSASECENRKQTVITTRIPDNASITESLETVMFMTKVALDMIDGGCPTEPGVTKAKVAAERQLRQQQYAEAESACNAVQSGGRHCVAQSHFGPGAKLNQATTPVTPATKPAPPSRDFACEHDPADIGRSKDRLKVVAYDPINGTIRCVNEPEEKTSKTNGRSRTSSDWETSPGYRK